MFPDFEHAEPVAGTVELPVEVLEVDVDFDPVVVVVEVFLPVVLVDVDFDPVVVVDDFVVLVEVEVEDDVEDEELEVLEATVAPAV